MNKKGILVTGLCVSLNLPIATLAQEIPDIQEGLWEISAQANVSGMKMPSIKMQQCFTQQSMNPENILQQNNCQINDMKIQHNTVRWAMNCQQEGTKMQGIGRIHYQKTSFSGTFDMTMSGSPQGGMAMQTQLTGRYIGKCN